jgi:hypothetical protein
VPAAHRRHLPTTTLNPEKIEAATNEKEINMLYNKPEIVPLPEAIESIQGGKANGRPVDSGLVQKTTIGAYEADE